MIRIFIYCKITLLISQVATILFFKCQANEFSEEWVLRNVNIFPRFTKMIWLIHTQHCCNTITKSFAHRKTLAYSHCCLAQYYRAAKLLLLGGESPKTCCVTPIKHIGDESNITLPFIVDKAN